jgi:hypothetical protein
MKRLFLLALALLPAVPANATTLLGLPNITTGISVTSTAALQTKDWAPQNLAVQCNFTYGSGGTSADAYVQTSVDGGATWIDVAQCHFTTSSLRELYNVTAMTPVTTAYTATDGTMTANTAKDGLLGSRYRVKYTTAGTYAGGTTLAIDVQAGRSRTQP